MRERAVLHIVETAAVTRMRTESPKRVQQLRERHPMNLFASEHEVAKAIALLGSDDSSFTTSSLLNQWRVPGSMTPCALRTPTASTTVTASLARHRNDHQHTHSLSDTPRR